jgi:serine/threonine protein kinase
MKKSLGENSESKDTELYGKSDNQAISIPNTEGTNVRRPVTVDNYRNVGGSSPAVDFLSKFMHTPSSSNLDDSQGDFRQHSSPIRRGFGRVKEGDIIRTSEGDLVIGRSIGRGAFSECRAGFLVEKKSNVSVKIVSKTCSIGSPNTEDEEKSCKWKIWQSLAHPNILPLNQIIDRDDDFFYLLTPLANESLLAKMQRDGKLGESLAKHLFKQLVNAVRYLHLDRGLVHGDIKLENILLYYQKSDFEDEINCWLTDFDFLSPVDQSEEKLLYLHRRSGSLTYLPPANLSRSFSEDDGKGDDIWAMGIVLYAMIFGELPKPPHEIISDIIITDTGNYSDVATRLSNATGDYGDLLRGMLEPDPNKRLNIDQIQRHRWLCNHSL